MKLVSWNVNGLRACLGKGFLDFFSAADADAVCLQETIDEPAIRELVLNRPIWSCPAISSSGTAPKKKGIPARLFLRVCRR